MPGNLNRRYCSLRTNKNPDAAQLELPIFRLPYKDVYQFFLSKEYFQEAFGYECVTAWTRSHENAGLGISIHDNSEDGLDFFGTDRTSWKFHDMDFGVSASRNI
jgi:hypothetical protein